jgi:hypothetical protein
MLIYLPSAPSYFSQFFEREIEKSEDNAGVRTLYIDRDPDIFQDISKHLQGELSLSHSILIASNDGLGYHVEPRDSDHFVKLFADAQFYGRKLLHHIIIRQRS